PCSNCANAIVQSGITKVILDGKFQNKEVYKRWEKEILLAKTIFKEGRIVVLETEKDFQNLEQAKELDKIFKMWDFIYEETFKKHIKVF
ncbi:MAG TPA: hypothetical protein VMZ91_08055, partial [Candidatus Paceibacterota bacterium]|nr:hypothetical protein [Candidatus Paceibacterota bacterium]